MQVQEQAEQVEERWIAAEGRHPVKVSQDDSPLVHLGFLPPDSFHGGCTQPGLPRPFEDIVKEVDCSSEDVLNLVVDGRRTQCVK